MSETKLAGYSFISGLLAVGWGIVATVATKNVNYGYWICIVAYMLTILILCGIAKKE